VTARRAAVEAARKVRDNAQARFDAGIIDAGALAAAKAAFAEAEIKLAQAEGDRPREAELLAEVVKQLTEVRRVVAERVKVEKDAPALLDEADAALADAKARLARVAPPKEPPPPAAAVPFDAAKAKAHQEAWAEHLGVGAEFAVELAAAPKRDMTFRVVPPGTFQMGAKEDEIREDVDRAKENKGIAWMVLVRSMQAEVPRRPVKITRPYAVGKYEVTVGQFKAFVDATGHETAAEKGGVGYGVVGGAVVEGEKFSWKTVGYVQDDDAPVWNVNPDDAAAFCKWLSEKDGRTFRLPTEAEWEYACRAGTDSRTYWGGSTAADARPYAWGTARAEHKPQRVGQLLPNNFGLYDMSGNVWEWCSDWYGERYYRTNPPAVDPTGPPGPTDRRVQRGGGVIGGRYGISSTARPIPVYTVCGFRVVMEFDRE
jgi:formylglycine-generating enzyme required for sulfatase activity